MTQDNLYDRVFDQVMARIEKASDLLGRNFKNVKPFQKEPVDNKELLFYYEQLTPLDMRWLIERHGEAKVNDFIYEMETKKRRQSNA